MRAMPNGRTRLADLLLSRTIRVCAAGSVGLLIAFGVPAARAQTSSAAEETHKQAKSEDQAGKQPPTSPRQQVSAAPAQNQDQNQGDQSLQPDPLANPVNPPATPDEPAVSGDAAPAAPSLNPSAAASSSSPPWEPPASKTSPPGSSMPSAGNAGLAHALAAGSHAPQAAVAAAKPAAFHALPVLPPAASSDPRRQQINDQCANLLEMANALKMEVDKTTKDELSVTVVRKAGQIERLARKVKDEMRPTMSRN